MQGLITFLGVPLKTLYVGNLVYAVTRDELKELFSEGALKAIDALNEKDFRGRNLRVNEARPRE